MNAVECRTRLIELLEAQTSRIAMANDFLVTIKNAIAENRLDQLQQSLASPDLAIDEIEQLEQQRFQLLSSYGFDTDSGGFEKCVAWCDDEQQQVSGLYQRLIQDLVQLQHSIQLNSLLVSKGKDRVRRSIGILTGVTNAGNCNTYSSNGQTLDPAGRRDIAIA